MIHIVGDWYINGDGKYNIVLLHNRAKKQGGKPSKGNTETLETVGYYKDLDGVLKSIVTHEVLYASSDYQDKTVELEELIKRIDKILMKASRLENGWMKILEENVKEKKSK